MNFSLRQCNSVFADQVATQLLVGIGSVAEFIAEYVPKKVALKAADAK
jgi:hypothetical protein